MTVDLSGDWRAVYYALGCSTDIESDTDRGHRQLPRRQRPRPAPDRDTVDASEVTTA